MDHCRDIWVMVARRVVFGSRVGCPPAACRRLFVSVGGVSAAKLEKLQVEVLYGGHRRGGGKGEEIILQARGMWCCASDTVALAEQRLQVGRRRMRTEKKTPKRV